MTISSNIIGNNALLFLNSIVLKSIVLNSGPSHKGRCTATRRNNVQEIVTPYTMCGYTYIKPLSLPAMAELDKPRLMRGRSVGKL